VGEPAFRRDPFRGTAEFYDRFRAPYPRSLIGYLAERTGADGSGRLLDLGCGTGQISFALQSRFAGIWAVDQEPGMIGVARRKARSAGLRNIRFTVSAVEDLSVPDHYFDLAAAGNSFHRLRRDEAAASVLRWLRPGGYLALLWGGSPWEGDEPWQLELRAVMRRWRTRAGALDRVPAGFGQARSDRPDLVVLREAGFEPAGSQEFPAPWEWTADGLIGFAYSTSVLSRAALGRHTAGFEEDLRRCLHACDPGGRFRQTIRFACVLARRPG
jgi:SAM-dependent methyltransferase